MSTIRITVSMKDAIVSRLMTHAFNQREQELISADLELGNQIYADVYSPDTIAKFNEFPEGYFPEETDLAVRFQGVKDYVKVNFSRRRIAYCHDRGVVKVYDNDNEFTREYDRLSDIRKKLEDDKKRVRREAQAIIESVTTLKKLIEIWPEVKPFVAGLDEQDIRNLPMIPIRELNRELGLPVTPAVSS